MFNVTDQCFMFPALRSFFVYEYNIYNKIEVVKNKGYDFVC